MEHPHAYLHGDDDCRYCNLHLAVDEEVVEQDLSDNKDGGDRARPLTQHWHIMQPRDSQWCQILYKEFMKMVGAFGDRCLAVLELPVLLDWLDVVRGVQTVGQCNV